ncbi:DUF6193 family natural product biosynthesis protein [Streptomyces sp. NBC_01420]|uniref:DUF6193 family natural product biosynthesis protein n=1 Tax=Streptomyces sp. NBC_01420 TaxID=2903858 RepID=UPI00324F2B46
MSGPRPDPAALYPEVAAHGSLAAALRAVAAGGLDAVPLRSPEDEPLFDASAATTLPHREPLRISAWRFERRWNIRGEDPFQSLALLHGETDDLAQVARAVRAWHDGESLEDIHRVAPFARPTGRFEVPDLRPGRLVESEWQGMLREAAELEYPWAPAYRSLIETAYAEPALRALYPFTSHWALRFSTTTRPWLTVVGPCLDASGEGDFGVGRGFIGRDLGEFATAREAVAAALIHLPAGLGEVALGTEPQ